METTKCQKCGQPLSILHWSSDKDISVCNNGKCLAYRNPVSYISYNTRPEPEKKIASRLFENPEALFGRFLAKTGSSREP